MVMASKNTKKCKKSLEVTFPKMRPEDVARDFLLSKTFCRMNKLYPEFDVVRQNDPECAEANLEINLWQKDRLHCQKRRSQTKTRQNLNKQWLELGQKEDSLKENFVRFNSFVRGNMEKRQRANQKVLEDMDRIETRSKAIEKLMKNFHLIEKAKIEMDTKIKEYSLYEVYLNEVVLDSNEFGNVQDLINRYLSLVNAKNRLAHLGEENLMSVGAIRDTIKKVIEEKIMCVTTLSQSIANLQARFEKANIRCLECEQLVTRIKNNAAKIITEIDEIKSSIWNIYVHMVHSKKHVVKIKKENVEEQARYIKRTLTELSKITNILKKLAKSPKIKPKAT